MVKRCSNSFLNSRWLPIVSHKMLCTSMKEQNVNPMGDEEQDRLSMNIQARCLLQHKNCCYISLIPCSRQLHFSSSLCSFMYPWSLVRPIMQRPLGVPRIQGDERRTIPRKIGITFRVHIINKPQSHLERGMYSVLWATKRNKLNERIPQPLRRC